MARHHIAAGTGIRAADGAVHQWVAGPSLIADDLEAEHLFIECPGLFQVIYHQAGVRECQYHFRLGGQRRAGSGCITLCEHNHVAATGLAQVGSDKAGKWI